MKVRPPLIEKKRITRGWAYAAGADDQFCGHCGREIDTAAGAAMDDGEAIFLCSECVSSLSDKKVHYPPTNITFVRGGVTRIALTESDAKQTDNYWARVFGYIRV